MAYRGYELHKARRQRFDFIVMALLVISLLAQPVVAAPYFQPLVDAAMRLAASAVHSSACDIGEQPASRDSACCEQQRKPSGDCSGNQCVCPDGILSGTAMTFAATPLGLLSLPDITLPENSDSGRIKWGSPPPIRPPIRA